MATTHQQLQDLAARCFRELGQLPPTFRYEDKDHKAQQMLAALEAGKAPPEWSQQQNAERPWLADHPLPGPLTPEELQEMRAHPRGRRRTQES